MDSRERLKLVSRFVLVGGAATAFYAVLALGLDRLIGRVASQATISLAAYLLAAGFSYLAHRIFTFASNGDHRFEVPRFALVTISGATISFALPVLLQSWFELPMLVPVIAVCTIIPLINFLVLERWVFTSKTAGLR